MLSVSPELAAAIEARERAVSVRLSVDWDGDGHGPADSLDDLSGKVAGVEVDRSLTTDLPDAVRVVEGSSVAQLKADLVKGDNSDERRHAAWYFSRSNAGSPLAGKERLAREAYCDLVFQTSAGPQSVRRFTGRTRRLPVSAGNRTAQLEALDYREKLRNPVSLIPTNGRVAGADGTWIVTQALYACGYNAGPVPRASGSLFWAPMYGSLMPMHVVQSFGLGAIAAEPSVAGPDSAVTYRPAFAPGPFVLAADGYYNSAGDFRGPKLHHVVNALVWTSGRGRWEQWVKGVPAPSQGPAGSLRHSFAFGSQQDTQYGVLGVQHDGRLYLTSRNASPNHSYVSTLTVPSDGAWHAVGIQWDVFAQTATFKVDGSTQTVATSFTGANEMNGGHDVWLENYAPYSDVHLHDIPSSTPWLADTVTTNAIVDASLLQLEACWEPDPREAWDVLAEIATAEQAVSRFDESGIYRYRTRKRLVDSAGQTVQRTLTADTSIIDLDIDDGVDQVRNIIQVPVTPVATMEKTGLVYSDTTQRTIPPGVATIDISFPNRVLNLNNAQSAAAPFSDSYVIVTYNSDGSADGGAARNDAVAHIQSWTPTAAQIVVSNLGTRVMYVTAISIQGVAAIVGNSMTVQSSDSTSTAMFGPQPLPIPSSRWVQTVDVAQRLADLLLADLKDPHPVISNLRIIGDPRLQLGDRARIQDPDGVVLDGEYWLGQIKDEISESGGYTQQISARQATNVFRWGVSRWGGPDRWGSG